MRYETETHIKPHIRTTSPSLSIHLPISCTHTSCLQTSNLVRFTFRRPWRLGVVFAECDLPCPERYYLFEEFNMELAIQTGAGIKMQRSWSKCFIHKHHVPFGVFGASRAPVSCEHTVALTSLHLSRLIHQELFGDNFSTGSRWPLTQREGQPAVITPCKCHLGLLIEPVLYHFNWFGLYHPAHTHICGAQRMRGAGSHLLFIHVDMSSLCFLFHSLFHVCFFPLFSPNSPSQILPLLFVRPLIVQRHICMSIQTSCLFLLFAFSIT